MQSSLLNKTATTTKEHTCLDYNSVEIILWKGPLTGNGGGGGGRVRYVRPLSKFIFYVIDVL